MSKLCLKYTGLNTVESISKVDQLHLHISYLLLCSNCPNDIPTTFQRNVSMVAVRGAALPSTSCLGHNPVVSNCKF